MTVVTYAQNREDLILEGFFRNKKDGFYVDVGAYDPENDSVTKLFYDKGWTGINIEPQPDCFKKFTECRTRDLNLNIGISDKPGSLKLRQYVNGGGLTTFSEEIKSEYASKPSSITGKFIDYTINVKTLLEVFEENNITKIDFMKIDVEGLEYEVIAGNDWDIYRPKVLCVEANHKVKNWPKVLKANNYKMIFFDGLNEYYYDDYSQDEPTFDYVNDIVLREPIANSKLINDYSAIKWLEGELAKAEAKAKSAQVEITKMRNENLVLHNSLTDKEQLIAGITPLRKHVKKSIRYFFVRIDIKIINTLSKNSNHEPTIASSRSFDSESAHENDLKNFINFNKQISHSRGYLIYYKLTRSFKRSIIRLKGALSGK